MDHRRPTVVSGSRCYRQEEKQSISSCGDEQQMSVLLLRVGGKAKTGAALNRDRALSGPSICDIMILYSVYIDRCVQLFRLP